MQNCRAIGQLLMDILHYKIFDFDLTLIGHNSSKVMWETEGSYQNVCMCFVHVKRPAQNSITLV